ncbi:MAG: hypothetical protein JW958_11395 [Candidatus Eisenbacteria bacterium]|nr:hypothetical protein [Candidatus Eisenbacteria bacterium]
MSGGDAVSFGPVVNPRIQAEAALGEARPTPPRTATSTEAIQPAGGNATVSRTSEGKAFDEVWSEACERHQLKFSQHAQQRLHSRNVNLGESELSRLGDAVGRAGEKGAKESLVLLDELAFVVSVKNRTVVTAMQSRQSSGVFTAIDSAVIA